jgi:site-specific DNA recombinase
MDPRRAVIYTRVSSDPRGIGRSTREQAEDCRSVADREGWQVVETFTDNDRAASRFANGDRPAYKKLVKFLQDGRADVLLTWEASRTQRDLDAYVRLRDLCRHASVLWCYSGRTYDLDRTDDAFATGLDALLAEREASQTRDRVLRSVRANAAAGRPHGKRVFGYRRIYNERTGELVEQVVDDEQAALVREAARRVLAGETPYAIAKSWNERGIPTPAGGRSWDLTQIRRLCTNPAYVAKRVHRGTVVADATWPPILDEATFYALKAKFSDPKRRTQRNSAVKHLLSGIAVCGPCGGRIRVQKNRGFLAYICVDGFHVSRREDHVDDFVTAVILERLSRPDVLDLLADNDDAEVQAAQAQAAELRARLHGFCDAAAAGELTPAALARIEATLLPQIEQAEKRARTAVVSPVVAAAAGPDIAERWGALPLSTRRELIDTLMMVEIMPTGKGRRQFDPSSIRITWKAGP